MRKLFLTLAAIVGLAAMADDEPAVSDAELWNEGVGYYEAGDVTNALRVLRPLVGKRDLKGNVSKIGANAAELVAKLCYECASRAEDPLSLFEEAADDAQIALRAHTESRSGRSVLARSNRNFTRAVDKLPELRETKRINTILKQSEGSDPGALLGNAMADSRRIMSEAAFYQTNAPAVAVAKADDLSARASRLADAWFPLRQAICQSVTNEEQAATILEQLSLAQRKTEVAAEKLGDLDSGAYAAVADAEHDFTRFHKMVCLPPAALNEDLIAQSNAWMGVEGVNGRNPQQDALDYTRAFRSKFPAWAKAYEQRAQADTNLPPFTAEDQAKISALATELEKCQLACVDASLPPEQEKALSLIDRIRKLMPPEKGGVGGSGQAGPRPQNQPRPKEDKDRERQKNDQSQDRQPTDQPRQEENPEQDQEQPEDSAEEPESEEEREVEAVLKKAQERSDEHEAEKKARMRKAPLPPNERDW